MKDRDAKMRERYMQKEYYGYTRLEKAEDRKIRKLKEAIELYNCEEMRSYETEKEREHKEAMRMLEKLMFGEGEKHG